MRISSDHHISGHYQTLFRQQRMLDSHLSHIKKVGNLMFGGKFSDTFALLGRLNILIRNKMIHHQSNLILIKHRFFRHFGIHLLDRHRRGNIISQNQIQIRLDQLSCRHLRQSGVSRQDFLRHRHSHFCNSSSFSIAPHHFRHVSYPFNPHPHFA